MKVRIKEAPRERELDGIRLDRFTAGSVHQVSATIGAWLIAQGYAESEMRQSVPEPPSPAQLKRPRGTTHRHRRSTD